MANLRQQSVLGILMSYDKIAGAYRDIRRRRVQFHNRPVGNGRCVDQEGKGSHHTLGDSELIPNKGKDRRNEGLPTPELVSCVRLSHQFFVKLIQDVHCIRKPFLSALGK